MGVAGDGAAPLLAIVGPTAVGKTELSLAVAERLGAEIVSVDSMLVYRGMDVGTAKPTPAQRARVPHHLLDVVEPSQPFSVAAYQELACAAVDAIRGRGRAPLLVGGTVLYLRAVADGLAFPGTDPSVRAALDTEASRVGARAMHQRLLRSDPAAARKIDPGNVRRTVRALEVAEMTGRPFSSFSGAWDTYDPTALRAAGVSMPREALAARIATRVRAMVEGGLAEEVRLLVAAGFEGFLSSSQAIGYAEMARHLAGELTLEEAVAGTVKRTKALARRQIAFLRRDPRIRWFEAGETGAIAIAEDVERYLRG